MYDWYDAVLRDRERPKREWVGFVHNVLTYPSEYEFKYKRLYSLDSVEKCPVWKANLANCLGLYTLSSYTADYLRTITDVPVNSLLHPTQPCRPKFSSDKFLANEGRAVLHLGQWLRKYHAICDLDTTIRRVIVRPGSAWRSDIEAAKKYRPGSEVEFIDYLANDEYDRMLTKNVVFLWLYDVAACNVILECLSRGTPLLINRHPAAEEYLGVDYPLFYETMEEASAKVNNTDLLMAAHAHMTASPILPKLTADCFVRSLAESDIYHSLKPPAAFL